MTERKAAAVETKSAEQIEQQKAQALADAATEAEANPRDETVEGGRYLVEGRLVDAEGKPVKATKKASDEDSAER